MNFIRGEQNVDKYKNILFENPRPFIIAQLENDRLIINETNISHEKNIDINLGDIKENREIKGLVKSTLEKKADNITINNIKNKFNLKMLKLFPNEINVVSWRKNDYISVVGPMKTNQFGKT